MKERRLRLDNRWKRFRRKRAKTASMDFEVIKEWGNLMHTRRK
jgi:hypothetical protein